MISFLEPTLSDLAFNFAKKIKKEFEMSMVGEFNFFLRLYINQLKKCHFFLSQSKYGRELMKKFGLEFAKHFRLPMSTTINLFLLLSITFIYLIIYFYFYLFVYYIVIYSFIHYYYFIIL